MAASPIGIAPTANLRRRPLALTPRRIEANRRNASRSTGPRTLEGKAKVGRNAIKHGFFAAPEQWSPRQRRDFEETLAGLRDEFQPQSVLEDGCIVSIAASYVRMAAMLRYENIAAAKYHQDCDRELNERIAAAGPAEAEKLEAERKRLRRAGLWRPTIPGPREAVAIVRYQGRLDRAIRGAMSDLQGLKSIRNAARSNSKAQKQTHFIEENTPLFQILGDERGRYLGSTTTRMARLSQDKERPARHPTSSAEKRGGGEEQNGILSGSDEGRRMATPTTSENAKTNPLSSMFTGNRHQRRRAKALAKRQSRSNP